MAAIEHAPAAMIGRRIPRLHDPRLLRGNGRYVDDIDESGMMPAPRSPPATRCSSSAPTSSSSWRCRCRSPG